MRLLIADDKVLFSALIERVLAGLDTANTVVACSDFDGAYRTLGRRSRSGAAPFDLITLNTQMPGMDGFIGLQRMLAIAGATPVAIMSGAISPAAARAAMRAGAAGFLPKTMPLAELTAALRRLVAGGRYFPSSLLQVPIAASGAAAVILDALTAQESEVLDQLLQGCSNKLIAAHLGIAEITVKSHLMHLYRKIDARNRADAVRIALRLKSESRAGNAGAPATAS